MIGFREEIIWTVDTLKYHTDIVKRLTAKKLKFVLIKNGNLNFISFGLNILSFVQYDVENAKDIIIVALINKNGIV